MKKILIVEDRKELQEIFKKVLNGIYEIVSAHSIPEAEEMFVAHSDISIIAMDGCVPGSILNTLPLVQKIRKTFTGDIVAMSTDSEYRVQLVKAGCNLECDKGNLGEFLLNMA
jgi:CheY-like chemotaxis protein